jgi:hypothetical protein
MKRIMKLLIVSILAAVCLMAQTPTPPPTLAQDLNVLLASVQGAQGQADLSALLTTLRNMQVVITKAIIAEGQLASVCAAIGGQALPPTPSAVQ